MPRRIKAKRSRNAFHQLDAAQQQLWKLKLCKGCNRQRFILYAHLSLCMCVPYAYHIHVSMSMFVLCCAHATIFGLFCTTLDTFAMPFVTVAQLTAELLLLLLLLLANNQ